MARPTPWLLLAGGVLVFLSSAGDAATSAGYVPRPRAHAAAQVEVLSYPHLLDRADRLLDGPDGAEIRLDAPTLLLWVDKEPNLRFVHATAYVLVSAGGVRVVDGQWWPVLNGRPILRGALNHAALLSPYEVPAGEGSPVAVHLYPEELRPGDELADGEESIAVITSATFLAWVDLQPDAYFTHPTVYLLVSADKRIVVREGGWWPVLNGRRVMSGTDQAYAVSFPFLLQ